VLDEARLPLTRGCTPTQAIGDGEDFELLFAVPSRTALALESAWKKRFPRAPLTQIGHLLSPSAFRLSPSHHGYDHFA
jgi:thiamine-monophosphate kinase